MGFSFDSVILYPQLTSTYNVIGKDWYGGQDIESITINHYTYPKFNLGNDTSITTDDTLLLDPGPGFDRYVWRNGTTNQTFQINGSNYQPGDYKFHVTVKNGTFCSTADTINVKIVKSTVGINDSESSFFKLFPNPATDHITIEFNSRVQLIDRIIIQDITGKVHKSFKVTYPESITIDISNLNSGIYIVKLSGSGYDLYQRFVIQR